MVQFMIICNILYTGLLSINIYRISCHAFSFISKVYNQIFFNLNNNTMSAQNFSNSSNNMDYLISVYNYVYYMNLMFCFVCTLLCIFWLVYVICDIISQVRNKRRLVTLIYLDLVMIMRIVSSCKKRLSYEIPYFLSSSALN